MNPNQPPRQPNGPHTDIMPPTAPSAPVAPVQPNRGVQPPQPPRETPPKASDPEPARNSGGPSLFERITSHWLVSWVIVPAALIFILHNFVFSAYHVVGSSMTPTLQDSNYLIIAKAGHTKALIEGKKYIPKRGEIIVFHYPKQPTLDFVKRVVGLPGDRVVIKDGKVTVYPQGGGDTINPDANHATNGTYTMGDISDNPIDITVPDDNVFVLGDNRQPNGSSDSREWGFLPSENIVGNVVLRLFPFNEIKTF